MQWLLRAVGISMFARTGEDRGTGVHPDDAERIFEKFGRGRPSDHKAYGVGLGLYLSRRIVRAHGGELAFRPAPRGGSVFFFDLRASADTGGEGT